MTVALLSRPKRANLAVIDVEACMLPIRGTSVKVPYRGRTRQEGSNEAVPKNCFWNWDVTADLSCLMKALLAATIRHLNFVWNYAREISAWSHHRHQGSVRVHHVILPRLIAALSLNSGIRGLKAAMYASWVKGDWRRRRRRKKNGPIGWARSAGARTWGSLLSISSSTVRAAVSALPLPVVPTRYIHVYDMMLESLSHWLLLPLDAWIRDITRQVLIHV